MPDLLIRKDGPVVVLTMNRPARRNAMTLAMFARLADAWDEIDADTDVRVCILTGGRGTTSLPAWTSGRWRATWTTVTTTT